MTKKAYFILAALCFAFLLFGCGSLKVSGDTTHTVQGHAVVEQRIVIDLAVCDEIKDQDRKTEGIAKLLEILETISPPGAINGSY